MLLWRGTARPLALLYNVILMAALGWSAREGFNGNITRRSYLVFWNNGNVENANLTLLPGHISIHGILVPGVYSEIMMGGYKNR